MHSVSRCGLKKSRCRRRVPGPVAFDEIAPILCAGVTVYKGRRVTDTRAGQ